MKSIIILFSICFISINSPAQYFTDYRVSGGSYPTLSVNKNGDAIIAWFDTRDHGWPYGKIYAQRFTNYYNLSGNDFPVNTVSSHDSVFSVFPRCALFENGKAVYTWLGSYGGNSFYLVRIFSNSNIPVTNPIQSNDSIAYALQRDMYDITVNPITENIYHVFSYALSPWIYRNVYLQRFDQNGNKIGENLKINDDTLNVFQEYPVITMRNDGSYIIAWMDKRDQGTGSGDIYMQLFDANDNRIGPNRIVNDDFDPEVHHDKPAIASDSLGNFVITWEDLRINNIYQNIYAQYFNSEGVAIGPNKRVDQDLTGWHRYTPKVAMSANGNTVIAWADLDGPNPTTVYFRRYNGALNPIGNQRKISNQSPTSSKGIGDIKLQGDRIMTVWADTRSEPPGPGVYYNILSFQNPDSIISSINSNTGTIPESFQLFQNYPNPFNPQTKIKFTLPQSGIITLVVYDISGREVVKLVNEKLSTGTYEYSFDGSGLSSGVYFYRLLAEDFVETRKMILLQ
jgi:hypothetical protein